MCVGILIYWYPNKEIPPQVECSLSSILSFLPSVTKTEGKYEKDFSVAFTLPLWPQPHVILSALKTKHL
jgi:hypothetical protein